MDFSDLVRKRRSIRRYEDTPVDEELLLGICEAARWAPSALNMQPWEFIIVTDPEVKDRLGGTAAIMGVKWPHIKTAPAVIVICAKKTSGYARDDCMLAAENIMLQATDLGLGTCYIGGFSSDSVRELLSIPEGYIVPGMVTVGYPAHVPDAPDKRPLSEIVHQDTFAGRGVGISGYGRAWQTFVKILKERFTKPSTPQLPDSLPDMPARTDEQSPPADASISDASTDETSIDEASMDYADIDPDEDEFGNPNLRLE